MSTESDVGKGFVFGCLLLLAYGLIQIYAGWVGIQHHLGNGWAVAAMVAMCFRFSLPLTIGAFFCATDIWGWHWAGALLFVCPGLLFMIPGSLAPIMGMRKMQQ